MLYENFVYLFDSSFSFTNFQIFLIIPPGGIDFLPKICSAVSFLPVKFTVYPPKVPLLLVVLFIQSFKLYSYYKIFVRWSLVKKQPRQKQNPR